MPKLEPKDEKVLKKIIDVLQECSYPKGKQIIKENEPLDKMFFVTLGTVGIRISSKPKRKLLKVGEHYGKELVDWALDTLSTRPPPLSVGTATTDSDVDVLILKRADLEKVLSDTATQSQ